jgi:hypothetical protein
MGKESPTKSIARASVTTYNLQTGSFLDHGLFQDWNMLSIMLTSLKDENGIAQANFSFLK